MGLIFNPFTGTFDFTGSGGSTPTTPGGSVNSVQYNNAGAFGGFGSWDWTKLTLGDPSAIPAYIQGWWGPGLLYVAQPSGAQFGVSVETADTTAIAAVSYASGAGKQAVGLAFSAIAAGPAIASSAYSLIGGGIATGTMPAGMRLYGIATGNTAELGAAIDTSYDYFSASPSVSGGASFINDYAFYAQARGGVATNAYSFWSDEQGVFRIRSDNTFNSVYQAIPALYNPRFTKYTAGAANFERVVLQWETDVATLTTEKGGTGTLRALNLGDAGTQVQINGQNLTLSGNLTTTGAFNPTFAIPSSSTWTFPSGGGTLLVSPVVLTTQVTGVLPVANGGTNASSASITAFNNITGYTAAGATGTTSTNLVFSTSPTFITPVLGVAASTSVSSTASNVNTQSINATSTDGYVLTNTTAAAAGAQQWSSRLRFTGQGWSTNSGGASMATDWIAENQPVQGAAAPTTNLVFSSQVNAGGYTARMTLTSAGALTIGNNLTVNGATFNLNGGGVSVIASDGSHLTGVRNSTNAQEWRVYNTFTNSTNYELFSIDWRTTSNVALFGTQKGSGGGTARVASWVYGGTSTPAISVPITSGTITFGGGITLPSGGDIALSTTTGTKIGTGTTQLLGFYNATPIAQGASVADASGGAIIDAEARTAINALISRIEATGLIATV